MKRTIGGPLASGYANTSSSSSSISTSDVLSALADGGVNVSSAFPLLARGGGGGGNLSFPLISDLALGILAGEEDDQGLLAGAGEAKRPTVSILQPKYRT